MDEAANVISSAQLVSEVDDLLLQILVRLPIKSQGKFRCVSKQWRSLIPCHPRPVPGLLLQYPGGLPKLDLLPLNNTNATKAVCTHYSSLAIHYRDEFCFVCVQSCNGLLLMRRFVHLRHIRNGYYVYNPLTGQHAALPTRFHSDHIAIRGCLDPPHIASLAYDPSRSPHYKVLCLYNCGYITIYSSETHCWSRCSLEPGPGVCNCYYGVYWNGSIYYILQLQKAMHKLYRFDIEREKILETPLPDGVRGLLCLVHSWGRLYLLSVADARGRELKVYEMEGDHSRWRLKYNLNKFGQDLRARFCLSHDLKICLHKGEAAYRISSEYYKVFFSPPGSGEEELWLVLGSHQLVYRYRVQSRNVVIVKAHHSHSKMIAFECAESMFQLP